MAKIFGQRWLMTLVAVVLISLVIWFGGPYLALGEHKPFESIVGRLVGILVVLAIWAAWLQISQLRAARASAKLGDAIAVQADAPAVGGRAAASGEGEVLRTHQIPFADFLADLQAGRRMLHGFQGGALWLLQLHAKSTGDPRLAALRA